MTGAAIRRMALALAIAAGECTVAAEAMAQAQAKALASVSSFGLRASKAFGAAGDGLADMLAASLARSGRFIVMERGAVGVVLGDRAAPSAGPDGGQGPDLMVLGTVTEFDPESLAVGPGAGGAPPALRAIVALELQVLDVRTSAAVASATARTSASDAAGLGALPGGALGVGLSSHAGAPMEKAIRLAIQEAGRAIADRTPAAYFRHDAATVQQLRPARLVLAARAAEPPPAPVPPPVVAPRPAPAPPPPAPAVARPPARYVKAQTANVRDQPSTRGKILTVLKQGARLDVVEERSQWYRVRLEGGKEGWVAGSVTGLRPE